MKILLILSLLFSFSYAGDDMNNGGGIGEQNIVHSYQNLKTYMEVCLQTNLCQLEETEKDILNDIKSTLDDEYKNAKQLKFISETKKPGTFIIDNLMKIAKTGSRIGSPIYFNTDLLNIKNAQGESDPLSIPQAVALLIHELGHHHGIKDHTKLDVLGNKVSSVASKRFTNYPLIPGEETIVLSVFNQKRKNSHPLILLYVYGQVIDITDEFRSSIMCNGPYRLSASSIFYNVFMTDLLYGSNFIKYTLKGNFVSDCINNENLLIRGRDNKMLIEFYVSKVFPPNCHSKCKPTYKFKKNSVKATHIKQAWWKN